MANIALTRLRKELKAFHADPPPHIHVAVDEKNILNWSYLLEGPSGTAYEGGWYWGRLRFPKNYPFGPPSILMMTPSGRFEQNTRLCLSMSDFHPESWQPAWAVATVLKGLLSFMCEDTPTTGSIMPLPSFETRKRVAGESIAWNKGQAEFRSSFPEFEAIVEAAGNRCEVISGAPEPTSKVQASIAKSGGGSGGGCSGGYAGEVAAKQVDVAAAAPTVHPAPSENERAFNPGCSVRVKGLQTRSDLNGQIALVEGTDASNGRVRVKVGLELEVPEIIAVKPDNLETCQAPGPGLQEVLDAAILESGYFLCTGCKKTLPKASFSAKRWKKRKDPGYQIQCTECAEPT
eukprot:gnl/MRDRNA2_/MRDRNA2_69861_c0_seq1.p1 gnl/MRDRNA2_/MRDRNA2_69861_c0~~gnl/MRDRNA2_/MRDRNA2_69861_c0_seq1.p1  ORF type:complete len:376 (-),score=56.86 gnl/MRDRNA2_/MRDRNA2_69861_c0_seq1:74-1114(-)